MFSQLDYAFSMVNNMNLCMKEVGIQNEGNSDETDVKLDDEDVSTAHLFLETKTDMVFYIYI